MLTYLQRLRDERDSLSQSSSGILETAATENRAVTDTERASIANMATRCASIDDELRTFTAQYESQRAYATLRAALDDADDAPRGREPRPQAIEARAATWGEAFVTSDAFTHYAGHGSTPPVEVPGVFEARAAIDSTTPYGSNSFPYVFSQPQAQVTTPLLGAVGHITTNSLSIQWLTDGPPIEAAVVAEGGLKPEADITVTPQTGALQTYAHWKGVTRQALADVPQIRSIIETQLRNGIYRKLETDTLAALAAATITSVPGAAGSELATIRQAIGTVQAQGFPNANGVVLNPADWAALDIAVMEESVDGPVNKNTFWGLKPLASAACPVGTMYVGDVRTGVTVFDMGKANLFMTDSHADYFVRNTLVVLAEIMALSMVTQPLALAEVTITAGP